MKNRLIQFFTPEKDGRSIGLFRSFCAVFGGLTVAYLGMTLVALLTPGEVGAALVVPLMFNTLAWACAALWIVLSPSKGEALCRCLVPTTVFALLIFILSRL